MLYKHETLSFTQCLELVQITLPVTEITHYQGHYTTSYYIFIVSTPVVQQYALPIPSFYLHDCQSKSNIGHQSKKA